MLPLQGARVRFVVGEVPHAAQCGQKQITKRKSGSVHEWGWLKSETAKGTGEICQEAVAVAQSRRGWTEAEVIWRLRHRTFGHFGRGGPWDWQVERPPAAPPQQTQETLRERWSGFKRWGAPARLENINNNTPSPRATAKEQLEEDKAEKNLRENRQHWAENQGTWCQKSQGK